MAKDLSHASHVAGGDKHCTCETIAKASGGSVFEKVQCLSKAFTLAEVLIVLGIIGLIADMTIPTLISSTQEKVTVSKLKKAYSTLENAFRLAVNENGTPENWNLIGAASPEGAKNAIDILAKYLNVSKNCGGDKGCSPDGSYRFLNGNVWEAINADNRYSKLMLSDGTLIAMVVAVSDLVNCGDWGTTTLLKHVCMAVMVDINGLNKPNQLGKDAFLFGLSKYGIVPYGVQGSTKYTLEEYCLAPNSYGVSCSSWAIYSENMDYLHCGGLSWAGKKKCK